MDPLSAWVAFAVVAALASATAEDPAPPDEAFGVLRGFDNPGNWFIEADRQQRGQLDRELLLTYRDLQDPDILAEVAAQLNARAKALGVKMSDYKSSLRAGMRTWYRPDAQLASTRGGPPVTFST